MHASDRLHALDAVRAFALLAGIALHAAQPFLAMSSWVTKEPPSDTLAVVWFTIHLFRMPLFFLIAGFFGRMILERRGVAGFVKDRSRRILVPLVFGLPVVMLVTGIALMLGALAAGTDLHSLQPVRPPGPPVHRSVVASINLIHLWFLYYLLIFYVGALVVRSAFGALLGRSRRLEVAVDAAVGLAVRSVSGPVVLALPIVLYYCGLGSWSSWGGLPAPFSVVPDPGALLAYGLFFGFGWLLHRRQPLLSSLERRWPLHAALGVAAWAASLLIGGGAPHWGPYLQGGKLLAYTMSYMTGAWCWSFALIGIAGRYLSSCSPMRRYLADSSYWLYLMHVAALFFFDEALHPLPWHWSVKYVVSIAGSIPILLLSYHYLVRFTFVGATLNGRKHPRVRREPRQSALGESS